MTRTLCSARRLACTLTVGFGALAGCSNEPGSALSPTEPRTGTSQMNESVAETGHLTSLLGGLGSGLQAPSGLETTDVALPEGQRASLLAKSTTTPFPERTNPFEFGKGVMFDAPQTSERETQSIQLYGFAGSDHPKAIIRVDDKTKMLSAGERWGIVEVLEVSPPTVRIKVNGIARAWSLLGHREQNGL